MALHPAWPYSADKPLILAFSVPTRNRTSCRCRFSRRKEWQFLRDETARASVPSPAMLHRDLRQVNVLPVCGMIQRNRPGLAVEIEAHQGIVAGRENIFRGEGQ